MARQSAQSNAKGSSSKGRKRSSSTKRAASPADKKAKRAAAAGAQEAEEPRVFDARTRNDIAGVAICVLAVALLVTAVMPSDAVVTATVSKALRLGIGVGAYLLPVMLLCVGVSFFVHTRRDRLSLRLALGLAIVFIAILALLGVFTPDASTDPTALLFEQDMLEGRGGYVGAGIAWVGLTLLGLPVSCVVLLGVVAIGLVITGLSLSRFIEHVREGAEEREQKNDAKARIVRADASPSDADKTQALPRGQEQQPTEALPKADDAQKTRRMRRIEAQQTQALEAAPAQADVTVPFRGRLDPAAAEDAPTTLTRRLGHKGEEKDKEKGKKADSASKAPRQPSSVPAPTAAPKPDEDFALPSMDLLKSSKRGRAGHASDSELAQTASCLQETLSDFGIFADVRGWVAGPTVTLFKVELPAGVRVSRVTALEDDIALALAAPGVRIFAPIPGTNYVGIEVPNRARQTVLLGDVLPDAPKGPLQICIGKDVEGNSIVSDLSKMPHLLIGGTTGSGKSVAINAMIMSILMRATPAEVRFIMIDPKRVEFTPYNGIPHLYVPVVTEPNEAASALAWGVAEMERRLKVFSKAGARNIGQYNAKVQAEVADQRAAQERGEQPPAGKLGAELPYIVIVIDELADLMMNVGKEVEFSISRIAQLARAAGIHLIVATQRPSTNVVTGLIKANITNRIAFNVASSIDSRVILDTPGAENLIGLGDLLFSKPEFAKPQRIQGCFVSEEEIASVVEVLKAQGEPDYHSEILQTNLITLGATLPDASGGTSTADDPLIWEAADIVVASGLGSTSNIQRRLKVGYSRAGRIMDMLEEKGIVGPPNGSKPREVLVDAMELETLKAFEAHDVDDDA